MSIKVSESVDVDSLKNVSEELKPCLKELLRFVDAEQERENSFTEAQINRIISNLNSGTLEVILANTEDKNDVRYVDYLAENKNFNGCYNNDNGRKRIALKNTYTDKMLSVLSHEFEHFVVDERTANNFNNKNKGGFNDFDKEWLEMWDEAAVEIIAAKRIGKKETGYPPRIKFIKTILEINEKTIDDLTRAYRTGDISFIYSLMPENFLKNISMFEKGLYDNFKMKNIKDASAKDLIGIDNNEYLRAIMKGELKSYISYINEDDKYKSMDEKDKHEVENLEFVLTGINNAITSKRYNHSIVVDAGIRTVINKEKDNCKTSEELMKKVQNLYSENQIALLMDTVPRLQLTHLHAIALSKAALLEDTSEIDQACSDFENRLIHSEKLNINANKFEENGHDMSYPEYEYCTLIQNHFEYKNGERYISESFDSNYFEFKFYTLDEENHKIICKTEDGSNSFEEQFIYASEIEFEEAKKQLELNYVQNISELKTFEKENSEKMQEIFESVTLNKEELEEIKNMKKSDIDNLRELVEEDNYNYKVPTNYSKNIRDESDER